ncbi:MAG: DUF2088 domain-containing protein [Rhodospirillales bacterium]|jgi:hypothetical protein|nr:DUF2088 domain-containing protein [Rhodospirillales bacterium]
MRLEKVEVIVPGLESFVFPRMVTIDQHFCKDAVEDVSSELTAQMAAAALPDIAGKSIAITAGSRGIPHVVEAFATIVRSLRERGAAPFIIPAMGSHGKGTAEGQAAVLEHQGITETSIGAPIRSATEVVPVATMADGTPLYCDKLAQQSDGIVVFNKIKPHTSFRGDWESGLVKMIVIGLGKRQGAEMVHGHSILNFSQIIPEAGRALLAATPILCGIGVVENAYNDLARIDVMTPDEIFPREKEILVYAKDILGRLLFPEIDVLIVDEIGKNFSGTGMDPNVSGRTTSGHPGFDTIAVKKIFVRAVSPASQGNANGIGAADFTTLRLVDAMDFTSTYTNTITSRVSDSARLPMILNNDREAMALAIRGSFPATSEKARVVRIANTKAIHSIQVSEAFLPEIEGRAEFTVHGDPSPIDFGADGNLTD